MSLTVRIASFSYKKGIPKDPSGNGGGYVFDCRGILNPGRIEAYKTQTGRDADVKAYLLEKTRMPEFLESVHATLAISLEDYLNRGFENLQISFGCTGGQHRSVFAADQTTDFVKANFPNARVELKHIEQEAKNWINEPY